MANKFVKLTPEEKVQQRLWKKINDAFIGFEKVENKTFLYVTEDGNVYLGKFNKRNFIHLSGILIEEGTIDFYNNIKEGKESYRSISKKQKYQDNTINKKCEVLNNIDKFVTNQIDGNNLVIEDYQSVTSSEKRWAFALRNDKSKYTLCFNKNDNSARSARREMAVMGHIKKKVICVFSKMSHENSYSKIEYQNNNYKLEDILEMLSPEYCLNKDGFLEYNKKAS